MKRCRLWLGMMTIIMLIAGQAWAATVYPPGALGLPATNTTGSYTVSMGTSATAGVSYVLEESTTGLAPWTVFNLGTTRYKAFTKPNGTYYYRAKATLGADSSAYTAIRNIVVNVAAATTAPPSAISLAVNSNTGRYTVTLGTSSTTGATYIIEESADGLAPWTVVHGPSATRYKDFTGKNGKFYYRGKATKSGIDSVYTAIKSVNAALTAECTACHTTLQAAWAAAPHGNPDNNPIASGCAAACHSPINETNATGSQALTCMSCHKAGNPTPAGPDHTAQNIIGAQLNTACSTCHNGDHVKNGKEIVAKVAAGPHGGATGHTTGTCQRCHATVGSLEGASRGWTGSYATLTTYQAAIWGTSTTSTPAQPVSVDGIVCSACHDSHTGGMRAINTYDGANVIAWDPNGNATVDQYDTCTACHTLTDNALAVVGNYHNGGSISVTRTISDSHADNPATGVGLASNIVEGYVVRGASASPCADCHDVHTADLTIQEAWADSAHAGKIAVKKDEAACAESITWFNTTYPTNPAVPVDACTDTATVSTSTRTVLDFFGRSTTGVDFYSSKGAIDDHDGNAWTHYNWDATYKADGTTKDRADCQRCHTATGAMNFLNNPAGYVATSNNFSHLSGWAANTGSPQQELLYCWGCHKSAETGELRNPGAITENYTAATTGGPVVTVTYPNIGPSNVCMGCHLGREVGQNVATDIDADGVRSFINSHYLTAGATLFNESGYEYAGQTYPEGFHQSVGVDNVYSTGTTGPCVTCHMTSAEGHTFEVVTKDVAGVITAVASSECAKCHSGLTAAVLETSKTEFDTALAALETALEAKGIYFYEAHPYFYTAPYIAYTSPDPNPNVAFTNWAGVYGLAEWKNVMGAAFNYNLLHHDPGAYAHNRGYTLKLILDSIDYLADGAVDGQGIPAEVIAIVGSSAFSQSTSFAGATHPSETNCSNCHFGINTAFSNSLHGVRPGKETFYTDGLGETDPAPLQQGFGNFVDVPYSELPCAGCHNGNDNGPWDSDPAVGVINDTWTQPTCADCHSNRNNNAATTTVTASVENSTCFGCHSRQAYELNTAAFGLTDVHISAGFKCSGCHSSTDIHGDGTTDVSQLDPGAITANCRNCHNDNELSTVAEHNQHLNDVDCSTCHAQSMVACYNCHFDNEGLHEGVTHQKFASAKFGGQGSKSWRFLVNRVMPDGSTKIFPGSMQSLMADVTAIDGTETEDQVVGDGQGVTFVAIASYYSHSITRDALKCADCHGTATVNALAAGQPVDVVKWLGAEGEVVPFGPPMMAKWQGPQGVIPVPENVSLLQFDFVDITDPAAPWSPAAMNVTSPRVLFKRGADVIHMPDAYVKPLTAEQMAKLADPQFDHTSSVATTSTPATGYTVNTCGGCHQPTNATFATSLHGTRQGKETFYNHNLGNATAEPLQKGFGNYVNVGYDALPCADCHNAAAWKVAGVDTWPAETGGTPVCTDCHTNKVNGAATTAFDAPVVKNTCIGCHSRQANETSMGLTDVHTGAPLSGGGTLNFACSDCHSSSDMHGDGTAKASQLEEGAVSAKCENCHTTMGASPTPEHTQHLADVACSTCHMESVITCYGCHFDNEASDPADPTILHAKFASGKFGGTAASGKSWRFLVNRVMGDGSTKVYPASMQSLVADRTASNAPGEDNQGWTHAAIAPYYSHSITLTNALKCDKCHGIQNAIDLNAGQPVRVVKWNAAPGVPVPVASMMANYTAPSGVIPVPENPVGKLLMDFVDLVNPAAGPLNASGTSPSDRVLFKTDGPDSIHMPEAYVTPLTATQINALATPQVRP